MRKLVKYEIKHSKEVVPQQCNHLLDEQKCKDTEFRYGTITGKYVIYRGAFRKCDFIAQEYSTEILKNLISAKI